MSESKGSGGGEPQRPEWFDRHLWQIQPLRDLSIVALVLLLLYLGYVVSVVTIPLLLALLLAYLFEPLVRRMTRLRAVSREGAAVAIIAGSVLLVAIPLTIGSAFAIAEGVGFVRGVAQNTTSLVKFAEGFDRDADGEDFQARLEAQAPDTREHYQRLDTEGWKNLAAWYIENADPQDEAVAAIETWASENARSLARATVGTGAQAARAVFSTIIATGTFLFGVFLTGFFFFFMSTRYPAVLRRGEALIPDRHRDRAIELIRKFDDVVAAFVRGRLTICVIQSASYSIGYALVGVSTPILLGVGVGILSIVPYLALVGLPVSIAMLALDPPDGFRAAWWWILIAPAAVYFLVQALDDYVLTPAIQGRTTNMDTPTILFASIAGGALAGVYGLLLAIPVAACIKIIVREVVWPRFRRWSEGRAEDPLPID